MSLSNKTIQDKNALSTDAVFLVLLEIKIPNVETIRVVKNTEDITWDGYVWQQFPFDFTDMNQTSTSEVPQWSIKMSNVNRIMERYIHDYDIYLKQNGIDGNDITCIIRVVNSNDLGNVTPIIEHEALLQQPSTTPTEATFKLSANSPYNKTFPPRRIMKSFCTWKFKSSECGYSGTETTCDKTLTRCRELRNSTRFGGFTGTTSRGLILV